MKAFFAFILLVCHMNTSMFLPQVQETDAYDDNGNQVEDINSVVEYFEVALGFDKNPDDEDDDCGQNFHLVKTCNYYFQQNFSDLNGSFVTAVSKTVYPVYSYNTLLTPSYDVVSPPPKA